MVKKSDQQAKHVLDQALSVLEHTMSLAEEKGDIDAMIGISDRLMMLYQHLSEGNTKKFKPGFAFAPNDKVESEDESD